MEESRMKKHVTIVGALQIGFSILWLIGAIFMYLIFGFAKEMVGQEEVAIRVLNIVGSVIPIFVGTIAILGLIGGISLLSYKVWGRVITIIVSGLGCFFIPIGTLLGVYSIWVLMQDETVKLFQQQ